MKELGEKRIANADERGGDQENNEDYLRARPGEP